MKKSKKDKSNKKSQKNLKKNSQKIVPITLSESPTPRDFNAFSHSINQAARSLWSNIRFSLAMRIALHYSFQLIRTSLMVLLVVTACFIFALAPNYSKITQYYEEVYLTQGQEAFLLESAQDPRLQAVELIPSSQLAPQELDLIKRILTYTFPRPLLSEGVLQIPLLIDGGTGGILLISYPFGQIFTIYGALVIGLLLADLFRVISFMRKRKNLNKKVLKPLRDISDMAATLGASNLSDRINTEGTKNELKDLSLTINHMLDRIERSYNSQKQFVSDASHELRTPIAVIQGYVQMLNRWGKNDKEILEEGIQAIAQETESMKDLVENLLFLARHDKKTLLLEMEAFDPCELVSALHRESLLVSPDHQYTFSPQDHCIIYGDKNMIKQALRILVDNAIKYSPSGTTIQLGIEKTPKWCVLSVTDKGSGMTKEEMRHIFSRFYRSDEARSSRSSGHGLGLSIARIIVNAHQGLMKVKSKPNEGSTFSILLSYSDS